MAIGVTEKENSGMGLGSSSRTVLKKKRPAKISIPMASLNFEVDSPRLDVMEVEDDGYSFIVREGGEVTVSLNAKTNSELFSNVPTLPFEY